MISNAEKIFHTETEQPHIYTEIRTKFHYKLDEWKIWINEKIDMKVKKTQQINVVGNKHSLKRKEQKKKDRGKKD